MKFSELKLFINIIKSVFSGKILLFLLNPFILCYDLNTAFIKYISRQSNCVNYINIDFENFILLKLYYCFHMS